MIARLDQQQLHVRGIEFFREFKSMAPRDIGIRHSLQYANRAIERDFAAKNEMAPSIFDKSKC